MAFNFGSAAPQQTFNPNSPQQASQAASSVGNFVANLPAPTASQINSGFAPLGSTNTLSGINYNLPKPQLVSNLQSTPFNIDTSGTNSSSILANPASTQSVSQARDMYQAAQQYDATSPVVAGADQNTAPLPQTNETTQSAQDTQTTPDTAQTGASDNTLPPNPYAQYAQQLATAEGYTPDYLEALKGVQDANLRQAQLQSNLYTGNNLPGDTLGYAQGYTTREEALNDINKIAATNNLNIQEMIRQGNIAGASALLDAMKPQEVGIGGSLVSPLNGQQLYQSPYLYRPTAGDVNSVAQQLLSTGQAPDYATAYNMAQQTVMNSAQGYQGFTPGTTTSTQQNPIYTNAYSLLSQGQPISTVLSSIGRSQGAKAIAQQAVADFLQQNQGYNATQAAANAKAAANITDQKATTEQALTAIDGQFPLIQQIMAKANINDSAPVINQLQNAARSKLIGDGDVVAYQSIVNSLQTEINKYQARGGQVTDTVRKDASLPIANLSAPAFNEMAGWVKAEGQIVLGSYDQEIQKLTNPVARSQSSSSGTVSWSDL